MVADRVIANFLRIARQDLDAAQRLASPYNRNAIYHCEQAAEKIIRAILTSETIHALGHQLKDMVDLVPDVNPMKPLLRAIQGLASYATSYRYVTASGRIPDPPSESEFASYAKKVEEALTAAVTRFGVDLSQKDLPAKTPGPIR